MLQRYVFRRTNERRYLMTSFKGLPNNLASSPPSRSDDKQVHGRPSVIAITTVPLVSVR